MPDANILLNLYRYREDTRNDYLKILTGLSDRLWIPHQVGREFFRHRLGVIQEHVNPYEGAIKAVEDFKKSISTSFQKYTRSVDVDRVMKEVDKQCLPITTLLMDSSENHPDFRKDDPLLPKIDSLFRGKIGQPYSDVRIQEIIKEAEKRYAKHIPPGFQDKAKEDSEDQVGDLILWFQIIDHARLEKKPIIFVTGDNKTDWFLRDKEGKTIGPRPELIAEIKKEADVECYLYTAEAFSKRASEFLDQTIEPTSQHEIEQVAHDRQQENEEMSGSEIIDAVLSPKKNRLPMNPLGRYSLAQREYIIKALNSLSDEERNMFVLHHYEDLTVEQVASLLNTSDDVIRRALVRAGRKLASFNASQHNLPTQEISKLPPDQE